jgi:hypothetical protein
MGRRTGWRDARDPGLRSAAGRRTCALVATALLALGAGVPARAATDQLRLALEPGCGVGARECAMVADPFGTCAGMAQVCVSTRSPVTRVKVLGPNRIARALSAGLSILPGAAGRGRAVTFRPPLVPGCVAAGRVALDASTVARLTLVARTARRGVARASVRLTCRRSDPKPPPDGPPPRLRFTRQVIDPTGGGQLTSGVAAGDVDLDGRTDIIVAGFVHLLWFRNPDWTPHEIAPGRFGAGARTIARDVDGDGRVDIITGMRVEGDHTIWLGNRPDGTWERHLLSDAGFCHDTAFGDLDGDGRPDALCVDQLRGRIGVMLAPPDPAALWTYAPIDGETNAMGAAIADVDGDGRLDAVAGLSWYRNDGGGAWTRVPFAGDVPPSDYPGFVNYAEVSALDVNGDQRPDIVATLYAETPAGRVHAYLAPADPVHEPWRAVALDQGPLFGVHGQGAASFDGSSRPQVLVAETNIGGFGFGVNEDPQLYVYRLRGDATIPAAWERTAIDVIGTHDAQVVDIDGDGLPDVIGHEENAQLVGRFGEVHLWRNETMRVQPAR